MEPKRNCTNIQIQIRFKALSRKFAHEANRHWYCELFWKLGWQSFSKMQPIAFLTYCPCSFEHPAHDLSRICQQETFVVDQGFGVGGRGANLRCRLHKWFEWTKLTRTNELLEQLVDLKKLALLEQICGPHRTSRSPLGCLAKDVKQLSRL